MTTIPRLVQIEQLKQLTGKGHLACDIALALAGNDVRKALERMKVSYPSMIVKESKED